MFSNKLKEVRLKQGYTLEQLAEKYNNTFPDGGLNKGTLSKYENNKQEPMITTVHNLSNLLDVSVDYLMDNKKSLSAILSFNPQIDEVDEMTQEIFDKRKILFDKSAKATKEDLDKMIAMFDVMFGKDE